MKIRPHLLIVFTVCCRPAAANDFESQTSEIQTQSQHAGQVIHKAMKLEAHFVPIVIPISNPTIGTGLGGGVLYMHEKPAGADPSDPASITGAFAMYTSSESWAAGGFHSGSYRDDSVRVSVPLAYGDFSVKFYGTGENSPLREDPLDYKAYGTLFVPKVSFETPVENWFVGCTYRLIDITTEFDPAADDEEIDGFNAHQKTAGVGLVSVYDTRDSNLWPQKGSWLDFSGIQNGEYAGGDYEYFKSVIKWAQYFQVREPLTLIYRLDGQYIEGQAPFWDLARIRLRGFSSGKYLDRVSTTAQAELRWNAYRRWHLSLFGGAGWIGSKVSGIAWDDPNFAGGTGFRYMLVQDQKLSIGIDLACGDGESEVSVYFQVGDWLAN